MLEIFPPYPGSKSFNYQFTSPRTTVCVSILIRSNIIKLGLQHDDDNKLLFNIQKEIEYHYIDGKSLHYESARMEEWDPNDKMQSSIFIVDCSDFLEMDVTTIQDIFQH